MTGYIICRLNVCVTFCFMYVHHGVLIQYLYNDFLITNMQCLTHIINTQQSPCLMDF